MLNKCKACGEIFPSFTEDNNCCPKCLFSGDLRALGQFFGQSISHMLLSRYRRKMETMIKARQGLCSVYRDAAFQEWEGAFIKIDLTFCDKDGYPVGLILNKNKDNKILNATHSLLLNVSKDVHEKEGPRYCWEHYKVFDPCYQGVDTLDHPESLLELGQYLTVLSGFYGPNVDFVSMSMPDYKSSAYPENMCFQLLRDFPQGLERWTRYDFGPGGTIKRLWEKSRLKYVMPESVYCGLVDSGIKKTRIDQIHSFKSSNLDRMTVRFILSRLYASCGDEWDKHTAGLVASNDPAYFLDMFNLEQIPLFAEDTR